MDLKNNNVLNTVEKHSLLGGNRVSFSGQCPSTASASDILRELELEYGVDLAGKLDITLKYNDMGCTYEAVVTSF